MADNTPMIDPAKVNSVPAGAVAPARRVTDTTIQRRHRQVTAEKLAPNKYNWGTGRRKTSIARVRIRLGEGKVVINEKGLKEYFTNVRDQGDVMAPLNVTNKAGRFDVFVNVQGGGTTGQAGACLLGLARALVAADPSTFETLRDRGFLTRDSREVERKKYGFRKARRSFQFSKR